MTIEKDGPVDPAKLISIERFAELIAADTWVIDEHAPWQRKELPAIVRSVIDSRAGIMLEYASSEDQTRLIVITPLEGEIIVEASADRIRVFQAKLTDGCGYGFRRPVPTPWVRAMLARREVFEPEFRARIADYEAGQRRNDLRHAEYLVRQAEQRARRREQTVQVHARIAEVFASAVGKRLANLSLDDVGNLDLTFDDGSVMAFSVHNWSSDYKWLQVNDIRRDDFYDEKGSFVLDEDGD